MKKHIIIGISTVIILIATICAVTFAAWDITSASIEIGAIKTPDNIQLKVTDNITNPENNKKLVPIGVAKNNNEADCINLGSFMLNLSSIGGANEADIALKVKLNLSIIDITTSVHITTPEGVVIDIKTLVDVMILLPDENGNEYTINNVKAKYKLISTTDEILVNTAYTVAIKFKDDYNINHDGNDAMIGNKNIKVVVNFNCVAR